MDNPERRRELRRVAEDVLAKTDEIRFEPGGDERDELAAAAVVGLRTQALAVLGIDGWLGGEG